MTSYLPDASIPYSLGTFADGGGEPFAGLAVAGRVRRLPDGLSVEDLLADWAAVQPRLAELATDEGAEWLDGEGLRPLVPWRTDQILQAGANYKKHVVDIIVSEIDDDEQGRTPEEKRAYGEELMDRRAAHGTPYVFIGLPSAQTGALDNVVLPPREGARDDWELELGVVIGKAGRNISREDAMSHIAGYTIVNDISSRDRIYRPDIKKIGTDWFAGKNSPTFLPTGPVIVPAQFVPDYKSLTITLTHNGTVRQDEAASDMIFDIPRLIEYCSQLVGLRPGDLVLTGSPAGNGQHWGVFLAPGDVMEATITGLGAQRNECVAG
ncbi:fumarylacetoacetate hydrolase family protein [Actinomycetota bacterium]